MNVKHGPNKIRELTDMVEQKNSVQRNRHCSGLDTDSNTKCLSSLLLTMCLTTHILYFNSSLHLSEAKDAQALYLPQSFTHVIYLLCSQQMPHYALLHVIFLSGCQGKLVFTYTFSSVLVYSSADSLRRHMHHDSASK